VIYDDAGDPMKVKKLNALVKIVDSSIILLLKCLQAKTYSAELVPVASIPLSKEIKEFRKRFVIVVRDKKIC
jgi:hypothetical protein